MPAAPPSVPDGAVIKGNDQGQGWLSALIEYAQGQFARATDAYHACQTPKG